MSKFNERATVKKSKDGKLIIERSCRTCTWECEDIQNEICSDFDFNLDYYFAIIREFPPKIKLAFKSEDTDIDFDEILEALEYK